MPTSVIYSLSLHDALPIFSLQPAELGRTSGNRWRHRRGSAPARPADRRTDRKSTRLNSSHVAISYAVFCLKKKRTKEQQKTNEVDDTRATPESVEHYTEN